MFLKVIKKVVHSVTIYDSLASLHLNPIREIKQFGTNLDFDLFFYQTLWKTN